jgi:hypothetical protein
MIWLTERPIYMRLALLQTMLATVRVDNSSSLPPCCRICVGERLRTDGTAAIMRLEESSPIAM